ncbi:MAG: DUF1145 domain-containing protein [Xanthomonadales bacterium]|nr:DUF1145 domain-containing protein [Xanthomonadales bacterium]
MFELMINLTKALLLAFWAVCILSLLSVVPEPYSRYVLIIAAVLLLLHFVEYLLVRSRVAERLGGKTGFIETMAVGFGYWLPVIRHSQKIS